MGHYDGGLPRLRFMGSWVLRCEGPTANLDSTYFDARFRVLREPLGFLPSAARLPDDGDAIHAWIEFEREDVVAVGRIHKIPTDSFGACADTVEEDATHCPDFSPLAKDGMRDAAGNPFPDLNDIRPAVQIRQMGTLEGHQRQGHASTVLMALESAAVKQWGNCTGFLQARVAAIPFYESQGWVCFEGEYIVDGIGLHCSMWKLLNNSQTGGE